MRTVPGLLILAVGCLSKINTDEPTGETGAYVTDTETDTDADADADADTDTDTDTDPGPTDTLLISFDEVVPPVLTGFGGVVGTVVVDPTDATNEVGRLDKGDAAELWAGATLSYCSGLAVARLPFTANNMKLSLGVWSPDAGVPIRLLVEDASNPTIRCETEASTTAAGAWETLVFDFSAEVPGTAVLDIAQVYDRVSVFPNFGTTGATAGAKTYYVDDLSFVGAVFPPDCFVAPSPETLPITFDDPYTTYTLTGFGGAEDAVVQADPDDGTNQVARATKSATAELWAGTTFGTLPGDQVTALPFTATELVMSLRVRSPRAGIPVHLKVEDAADPTRYMEIDAFTVTGSDTWETLNFDFGTAVTPFNATYTYNRVSVFFDFGTSGANGGGGTFYFDDLSMVQ